MLKDLVPAPTSPKPKLFIGLPVAQKIDVQFMECITALQKKSPFEFEIHYKQGDGIARSRNILTAKFLKTDCTHLLFIDCDLIFSAEQIERLLKHDLPVVAGFYPKKQEGKLEWVVNTLLENPAPNAEGLQRVKYAGTGFLMIRRDVFEKMILDYPEIAYREDYGARELAYDFWAMAPYGPSCAESRLKVVRQRIANFDRKNIADISIVELAEILNAPLGESRYLSEDWYFCQRWLDMGNDILMDTHIILRHIGTAIYPLQTQLAEIAKPN
jgi:hypothetical protein